ncbi:hypothetical protein BMS17_20345 [Pseudomonas sp. C9]|nr:hypothetical protein BMS17_20345 [Pseudomonas sp. C9]
MTNNKLFSGYRAVQDWSRVAVHRCLHRMGTSSWKREAAILLSVLVVVMAGYLTVFHFASRAVQDLVGTCTARLESELENAGTDSLTKALARPLCECVAYSFLDKNGIVRLAMVSKRMFDPMDLEPVTEEDEEDCISALWLPNAELAKRLPF